MIVRIGPRSFVNADLIRRLRWDPALADTDHPWDLELEGDGPTMCLTWDDAERLLEALGYDEDEITELGRPSNRPLS